MQAIPRRGTVFKPAPIPFPDQPDEAREFLKREAGVFGEQMRHHDSIIAATKVGHQAGYRGGYVDGFNTGRWTGGFVGFLLGAAFAAAVIVLRSWAGTL